MEDRSEIRRFFRQQNVFVTGGTGFVGKLLIEKLLRSTEVSTIYLLVREKKGKSMLTRVDELFDDIVFDRLKKECPKFKHRIVGVSGDCSITGLGMTIDDRQRLLHKVNVVFHVAATVRFDENLKLAYAINVNGTRDVMDLCRQMAALKSLVHVSTAYSNCNQKHIDEMFYDHPVNYDNVGSLLEKMSSNEADKLTPRIIGNWPNTYTFTKALAESLMKSEGNGLPIGIFRPGIVISTYKEPIPGWTDNLYGPTGSCAAVATGLLHVMCVNGNAKADVVPADTCVAGLIASAWDTSLKNKERSMSKAPIYNCISSEENPITWGEYNAINIVNKDTFPFSKSIWTTKFTYVGNYRVYLLLRFILHIVPGVVMDAAALLTGRQATVIPMYRKIHKFIDVLVFFCTKEWTFRNGNMRRMWEQMNEDDRHLFPLSMKTIPWLDYFRNYYLLGIRVYLLRDPLDTVDEARVRNRRFQVIHEVLMFGLRLTAAALSWYVLSKITNGLYLTGSYFYNVKGGPDGNGTGCVLM